MNTIEPKGVTALQSRHCTVGHRDGLSEEDVQKSMPTTDAETLVHTLYLYLGCLDNKGLFQMLF